MQRFLGEIVKLKKVWNRRSTGGDVLGHVGGDDEASTGVRVLASRRPSSSGAFDAEWTQAGESGADEQEDGGLSGSDAESAALMDRHSWLESRGTGAERHSSVVQRSSMLRSPEARGQAALRADAERATTLVIMEAGASWPVWVKDLQRRAPNSMVEVQPSSESAQSFSERVQRRLASLRQRGVTLVGAAYAASSPASDEERETRRQVCVALLEHLSPAGELVLSGTGWSTWGVDARSREELMGLAGDLSCGLRGRTQTVSVRFSDPIEESGVHKAPPLAGVLQAGLYGRGARESA
jgi:hypothetical protein